MGLLDRLRDTKEAIEEKVIDPVYRARERRRHDVERAARQEFRERSERTKEKLDRGEISEHLAKGRLEGYGQRFRREKIPIEDRVQKRAGAIGSSIVEFTKERGKQFVKDAPRLAKDFNKGFQQFGTRTMRGGGVRSPYSSRGSPDMFSIGAGTAIELYPGQNKREAPRRPAPKKKKSGRKRSRRKYDDEPRSLLW